MATIDPHAAYEQKLSGLGYEPLPEFAILDECDFHDKKTNQNVKFDKRRLEKLAKAHNELIEKRESPPAICLGHTREGAPENEQPPVVGLATRFTVRPLRDGKNAVFVRPWAKPGQKKTFQDNMYRSVELWLDPDAVHPIALLGPTAPRRDGLGAHLFDRNQFGDPITTSSGSVIRFSRATNYGDAFGRTPILFSMKQDACAGCKCAPCKCPPVKAEREDDMDEDKEKETEEKEPVKTESDTPPEDSGPKVDDDVAGGDEEVAKVMNSEWGKKIESALDKILAFVEHAAPIFASLEQEAMAGQDGGPPGAAHPGAAPGGPPGAPPPGAAAPGGPPPMPAGEDEPPRPDLGSGPPKKNSAGSSAGYGNATMPQNQFSRFAAPVDDDRVVKLQRQVADLVKENAAIRLERIETEVSRALKDLAAEGYAVQPEVDGPDLCRLSREKREERIKFMRETRSRKDVTPLPGGGQEVIDKSIITGPVRFERAPTDGVAGDPALATQRAPEDYEALQKLAGEAKRQGFSLKDFDVRFLTPPTNGVQVR